RFIGRIADEMYPNAKKITLISDNFGTHTLGAFYEAFCPEEARQLIDRFEFINTPKHGSWLNMAEIELHCLNTQCLSRHIATMEEMQEEVLAWQTDRNNKNCKINWQFTAKDARIKLKRLYPSFNT
ncbi:MAG: transposase, partial [Prevotellaceae bacterium]|nr:transposase [Prevotellaceae bacterium]